MGEVGLNMETMRTGNQAIGSVHDGEGAGVLPTVEVAPTLNLARGLLGETTEDGPVEVLRWGKGDVALDGQGSSVRDVGRLRKGLVGPVRNAIRPRGGLVGEMDGRLREVRMIKKITKNILSNVSAKMLFRFINVFINVLMKLKSVIFVYLLCKTMEQDNETLF